MTAFLHIVEGLNGHEPSVHHARPYGEPDNALVRSGILRCEEQKHTKRRIDSDDHHQIMRVSMSPSPTGGPNNAQRINTEYESQSDNDQRDTEIKLTICVRHFSLPRLLYRSFIRNFPDELWNSLDHNRPWACPEASGGGKGRVSKLREKSELSRRVRPLRMPQCRFRLKTASAGI